MTKMQMLLLLAHQVNNNPELQKQEKENKSNEIFEKKLKEAQNRSKNKLLNISQKDSIIKEAQEKMLNMIDKGNN